MISQALKIIGQQAKKQRQKLGLNQTQAALKISAYRRAISEIENGQYSGNIRLFERYMSLLNLELSVSSSHRPDWDDIDTLYEEDE